MRIIIADLTNANPGSERNLLTVLSDAFPVEAERAYIDCRTNQQAAFAPRPSAQLRVLPATAHYNQIASFIQREFLDGVLAKSISTELTMTLLSFHPAVLGLRAYLATPLQARVDSIHWGRLFRSSGGGTSLPGSAAQALSTLLTDAEALGCVQRALSGVRAIDANSAIRMSDIRFYLEREEPRLKKTNPGAHVQGIIGALVDLASRRGLVVVDRNVHPVNPPIWLSASAIRSAGALGDGQTVQIPGTTSAAIVADGNPVGASGGAQQAQAPAPVAPPSADTSPPGHSEINSATAPPARTKASRSDSFVDSLRKQGLGPSPRTRPPLSAPLRL